VKPGGKTSNREEGEDEEPETSETHCNPKSHWKELLAFVRSKQ
jgi:hypothetical protein